MRIHAATLALGLVALLGCDDDVIGTPRGDSGVAEGTGPDGPLTLTVGMRMRYQAQLNYRGPNGNQDSTYDLELEITRVDDQGAGQSSLTFTASGQQTFQRNWEAAGVATGGFDSWVSRLGPSDGGDVVSPAPKAYDLSQAPALPRFPKALPAAAVFFLDLRDEAALRSAFVAAHAGLAPSAIAPAQQPEGRWALALDGEDTSLTYYDQTSARRRMSLEYDPRGFIVRIDERLGDSANHPEQPNGSFTLQLAEGPP